MNRIELLRPRGFLSFAEDFEGVPLGALNLLVGPNGSGKSNFLEAARFVSAAPSGLRGLLTRNYARIEDWCHRGGPSAAVELVAATPLGSLHYELSISNQTSLHIEQETLAEQRMGRRGGQTYVRRDGTRASLARVKGKPRTLSGGQLDPTRSILEQIKDPAEYPEMDQIQDHLASYQFATQLQVGSQNPLRQGQSITQEKSRLTEDGKNLAVFVNALLQRGGMRKALVEHMREVYPGVEQVEVDLAMGEAQIVFIEDQEQRTTSSRLSDGTMRWLFLGALLLDEQASSPLFLDEPELTLHPDAIGPLAQLLLKASARRQLIVSTHSSSLLDHFTSQPEVVHVFERREGHTSTTRLSSKRLQEWVKTHDLGDVWRAGAFGGNRW